MFSGAARRSERYAGAVAGFETTRHLRRAGSR